MIQILLALLVSTAHAKPASDYTKGLVIEWTRQKFADPYSLRSPGLSEPFKAKSGAWVVCVEYNAKNLAGGYTGLDRFPLVATTDKRLLDASYTRTVDTATCYGSEVIMHPFPELSRIR